MGGSEGGPPGGVAVVRDAEYRWSNVCQPVPIQTPKSGRKQRDGTAKYNKKLGRN